MTRPKPKSKGAKVLKARGPFPFPTAEDHSAKPAAALPMPEEPSEEALDHGLEESFPASDPVSVSVTKAKPQNAATNDGVDHT